jgi:hypothetical protein
MTVITADDCPGASLRSRYVCQNLLDGVESSALSGRLPGAQPVFMTAWTESNYRAPTARPGEAQERCHVLSH